MPIHHVGAIPEAVFTKATIASMADAFGFRVLSTAAGTGADGAPVTRITLAVPVAAAKHPESAARSARALGKRLVAEKVCSKPIFTILRGLEMSDTTETPEMTPGQRIYYKLCRLDPGLSSELGEWDDLEADIRASYERISDSAPELVLSWSERSWRIFGVKPRRSEIMNSIDDYFREREAAFWSADDAFDSNAPRELVAPPDGTTITTPDGKASAVTAFVFQCGRLVALQAGGCEYGDVANV